MAQRVRNRRYCFTIQVGEGSDIDLRHLALDGILQHSDVRGWVYQLEAGENCHYQGYVEFTKAIDLTTLQLHSPGTHFETARGSKKQCVDYCMKEDTRVDGPFFSSEEWLQEAGQVGGQYVFNIVFDDITQPPDTVKTWHTVVAWCAHLSPSLEIFPITENLMYLRLVDEGDYGECFDYDSD